jgi:alkanal monooxygenase alpha chain
MKFGIFLTTGQLPGMSTEDVFQSTIRHAHEAETLGFDDAWVLEHHFTRYGLCSNPMTMASFLLGGTEQLRVGTAVAVLPLYHPIHLAEQAAIIDQLSGGRLLLGVGRGAFHKDFDVFGGQASESHEHMRESLKLMVQAWTQDVVESKEGRHTFPAVPVYPAPYSRPHPPVYVVCESPATTEWVASQGYPMILSWWIELERMRAQIELYEEVSRAHGHDPTRVDHIVSCIASVGDTSVAARNAIRENFMWWRQVGAEAHFKLEELRRLPNYPEFLRRWEEFVFRADGNVDKAEEDIVERLLDINIVGSPSECVARIEEIREATRVEHFVCGFDGLGASDAVVENMRRFAHEVIPALRGSTPLGDGVELSGARGS